MSNYVFYDFETSSSNKYWGQIIQIGAVLTNDNLDELDRFDARCRLSPGVIPEAMALVQDLRENYGIFCSIVVYPVIPKGLILLRLIPTATHTLEDVDITLKAFSGIREKLENGTSKRLSLGVMASS